jgi:perosamine synthetase
MIPLFKPYIPVEVLPELKKVFNSGCITQGSKVSKFEDDFKKMFKVTYAVSLNSGTSALEMAYDLLNLKSGDEVISTPLTCTATNIPLLTRGVKIVWADILEDTLCIDPVSVNSKLTQKTKAIVQVHLGGVKADVGKIFLPIVSDAAQALGIFNGDYTCCSFQAIKHITTGDGGMLVIDDEGLSFVSSDTGCVRDYDRAKLMRWFGINRERSVQNDWESYRTRMMSFDIEMLGYKRHMNDINATMGIVGLRHYQEILNYRAKIFNIYRKNLNNVVGVKLIDGDENVYWLATLLVERRDDFAKKLWEAGIETNVVQIRNDTYKIFGGVRQDLPVMNAIESKYISIPLGMHVTEENAEYICSVIQNGW